MPQRALADVDINNYANLLNIPNFRGVFMRDSLPARIKKHESGVVNLDSYQGAGTHWVAYHKCNHIINYFNSFGNLKPPPELVKYFKHGINTIFYNHDPHQTFNQINCGHLCLQFLFTETIH